MPLEPKLQRIPQPTGSGTCQARANRGSQSRRRARAGVATVLQLTALQLVPVLAEALTASLACGRPAAACYVGPRRSCSPDAGLNRSFCVPIRSFMGATYDWALLPRLGRHWRKPKGVRKPATKKHRLSMREDRGRLLLATKRWFNHWIEAPNEIPIAFLPARSDCAGWLRTPSCSECADPCCDRCKRYTGACELFAATSRNLTGETERIRKSLRIAASP